LKRVRDYAQVTTGVATIKFPLVEEAMAKLKVDKQGLDELDRRILTVILETYQGGPVGIEALAATLNEETDTIVDVVEPYLLKIGFLRRTSRGREITDKTRKHLLGANHSLNKPQKELF
jgi:Holliday junction DNA helicase RuvB